MTPPDVEFTAVLAVADRAMRAVLGDRAAWVAESENVAAEPLPWPLQQRGEGYLQLLRILAVEAVHSVLQAIESAEGGLVEADPASHDFQVVLRVVHRAVQAADIAICSEFKPGRLTGKRSFANWAKAREVQAAVQSGEPRAAALGKLPLSRAAAYRAMKRRR